MVGFLNGLYLGADWLALRHFPAIYVVPDPLTADCSHMRLSANQWAVPYLRGLIPKPLLYTIYGGGGPGLSGFSDRPHQCPTPVKSGPFAGLSVLQSALVESSKP